jgi:predicted PurR-regulated permease PerM
MPGETSPFRTHTGAVSQRQSGRGGAVVRAREATSHLAPAEPRVLGALAIMAVAGILCVLLPVGVGVFLGALLAFALHRVHRRLVRATHRPTLVALGVTLAASSVVAAVLGTLVYLVVLQGVSVAARAPQYFSTGGPADILVGKIMRPLSPLGLHPEDIATRLRDALGHLATSVTDWAARIVGTVVDGSMALFFMAMTMFFVLRHWAALTRRAERLMPLNPHHTRHLLKEVRRLGRTAVVGNFGTSVLQGLIAGIGLWIAHVPQPAFYGAVTAVASLIPGVGTLLVWVPAGMILMATGHTGWGVFELAWGAVAVVGFCDYVVRPRLVGNGETLSTWMTFVALFGGLKLFGFLGVLLGPLLVGVSLATLRMYGRERRFRLGLRHVA